MDLLSTEILKEFHQTDDEIQPKIYDSSEHSSPFQSLHSEEHEFRVDSPPLDQDVLNLWPVENRIIDLLTKLRDGNEQREGIPLAMFDPLVQFELKGVISETEKQEFLNRYWQTLVQCESKIREVQDNAIFEADLFQRQSRHNMDKLLSNLMSSLTISKQHQQQPQQARTTSISHHHNSPHSTSPATSSSSSPHSTSTSSSNNSTNKEGNVSLPSLLKGPPDWSPFWNGLSSSETSPSGNELLELPNVTKKRGRPSKKQRTNETVSPPSSTTTTTTTTTSNTKTVIEEKKKITKVNQEEKSSSETTPTESEEENTKLRTTTTTERKSPPKSKRQMSEFYSESEDGEFTESDEEQNSPGSKSRKPYSTKVRDGLFGWLELHSQFPYPNAIEKRELCLEFDLNFSQLDDWMVNARRRYKARLGLLSRKEIKKMNLTPQQMKELRENGSGFIEKLQQQQQLQGKKKKNEKLELKSK